VKQLGGLLLPNSMQWVDRDSWSPVIMETARTLAGASVTWSQPLSAGRPVTLAAEDGVTWLEQSAVNTLKDMAAQAGVVFPLVWEEETFTVMFRHNEPPAILFRPIWPHFHLFTGTLKLMTV